MSGLTSNHCCGLSANIHIHCTRHYVSIFFYILQLRVTDIFQPNLSKLPGIRDSDPTGDNVYVSHTLQKVTVRIDESKAPPNPNAQSNFHIDIHITHLWVMKIRMS
jgi:hypothetical protein